GFARIFLLACKQGAGPPLGGRDAFAILILKRDGHALEGAPGGNVATHDAGADHVYMLYRPGTILFFAEGFEAFLQSEYAQEIAGGIGAYDGIDERRGLERVAIVLHPDLKNGARGGVMFAGVAFVELFARLPGDQGAQ